MFWVDLAFELYEDAMVFRVLLFIILFLFRTNAKKGYLDENVFWHSYHFESYLITAMLKVPNKKYEVGTLTAAVCKTSYSLRFYVHGTKFMLILLSRLENKHHETKADKGDWKLSVEQASEFALQKNCTKVDDISRVLIRFFFSQKI